MFIGVSVRILHLHVRLASKPIWGALIHHIIVL